MSLADLQAHLDRCRRVSAQAGADRAALIAAECFEDTQDLDPTLRPTAGSFRWIADDETPPNTERWPLDITLPPGWHEVTAPQAAAIRAAPPVAGPVSYQLRPSELDVPRIAAIESQGSAVIAATAPRTARLPREPRASRTPRTPRSPRYSQLFAPERTPRRPRVPRKPRVPRVPRARRPRRPRQKRTKYSVGVCKRPGCTCWTPAGCAHDSYLEMAKALGVYNPECWPGPCYDYTACVTGRCFHDVTCAIIGIVLFWQQQYRLVSNYVATTAPLVIETVRRRGVRQLIPGPLPLPAGEAPPLPPGAITTGCPPGWYWQRTTIGCRCGPPGAYGPPADAALLAACGISL